MRTLNAEAVEERGVALARTRKADVAEEAPHAHKDTDDVMRWQRDLVEPRIRLRPFGASKG